MKKSGVNLLFLLIIISISLATSIRYPRHSSKSYSEICDDREKQWQKEEELRVKKLREGMSEKLNNMYGDGLWKEDFSEEKKILDEALKKSFTENCNVSEEIKNIFSIDMIYYNSCLKELNEGRLTIDEFIKYPYKYTYSGTVNCYVYEIIEKSQDDRSNYDTFISNFKNLKMMNDKIDYCIYYLSNLEEISLNYKKWNSLSNIDNVYENIKNQQEDIVAIKKRLNELYNEQFLYSQKDYGYYSINRPDVIFDVYITDEEKALHTKYLTVLTQKYFTDIVNEIIKEEGGGSAVIPYVRPLLRSYEVMTYMLITFRTIQAT